MNEDMQNIQPRALMIIWLALSFSPVVMAVMMYVLVEMGLFEPVDLEFNSNFLFWLALASAVIPLVFIGKLKRANRVYEQSVQTLSEDQAPKLMQYYQLLVIGLALAELPTILGLVYFLLSGDGIRMGLLVVISLFIAFMMKPELPRQ